MKIIALAILVGIAGGVYYYTTFSPQEESVVRTHHYLCPASELLLTTSSDYETLEFSYQSNTGEGRQNPPLTGTLVHGIDAVTNQKAFHNERYRLSGPDGVSLDSNGEATDILFSVSGEEWVAPCGPATKEDTLPSGLWF